MAILCPKCSEAARCLKEFHQMIERESIHGNLLAIRSDNAPEFIGGDFAKYCKEQGIQHQTMAPYSSASNSVAERVLRTIQENGLTALHEVNLTIGFWPEAFAYAIYSRNRTYHSTIKSTPFTQWHGHKPSVRHMRPFGCDVKYIIHPQVRRKGAYHAEKGQFIGYYNTSNAYNTVHTFGYFKKVSECDLVRVYQF